MSFSDGKGCFCGGGRRGKHENKAAKENRKKGTEACVLRPRFSASQTPTSRPRPLLTALAGLSRGIATPLSGRAAFLPPKRKANRYEEEEEDDEDRESPLSLLQKPLKKTLKNIKNSPTQRRQFHEQGPGVLGPRLALPRRHGVFGHALGPLEGEKKRKYRERETERERVSRTKRGKKTHLTSLSSNKKTPALLLLLLLLLLLHSSPLSAPSPRTSSRSTASPSTTRCPSMP